MIMTGGMATIAGTVYVLYATILRDVIPDVAGQILIASIISAPAAILVSHYGAGARKMSAPTSARSRSAGR